METEVVKTDEAIESKRFFQRTIRAVCSSEKSAAHKSGRGAGGAVRVCAGTDGLFEAPAGVKHHGAWTGGLYDHSKAVAEYLESTARKLGV